MAITFPRDLPSLAIRAASFTPAYQQVTAPTRGGLVQVANIGVDLWTVRYETPSLDLAASNEWRAWLHSLRGGARTFRAIDPARRWARTYPTGYGAMAKATGGSFSTGIANLASISNSRDVIGINDLPADFKLEAGDLLSYQHGTSQILHEVTEGATGSSGGLVTVTVEPTVPVDVTITRNVSLALPWFEAVIDAPSIGQLTWQIGRRTTFQFSATQIFR